MPEDVIEALGWHSSPGQRELGGMRDRVYAYIGAFGQVLSSPRFVDRHPIMNPDVYQWRLKSLRKSPKRRTVTSRLAR